MLTLAILDPQVPLTAVIEFILIDVHIFRRCHCFYFTAVPVFAGRR